MPFSGPKGPICHEQIFFGTNHFCYFHLPIGTFHWAKFKKILTADPELWGCAIFGPKMVHLPQTKFFFIGRELFLAITWQPDFSQACSFCRMLMNHKNFHFTQIPDKINNDFLKKSKNHVFVPFWPFLVIFA